MTLVYLGTGWLVGLALAAACPLPWWLWLALGSLPITAAILERTERPRWRLYLSIGFAFLGATRSQLAQPRFDEGDLASYNNRDWGEFEGYVDDEPQSRGDTTRLTVAVQLMELEFDLPRRVAGRALLVLPRYLDLHYGERLRFSGRLETPPAGDDFSYRDYLARQNIYSLVRQAAVEPLPGTAGSPLKGLLLGWKDQARKAIRRSLPDPEGALLTGILLGDESGLPKPLLQAFDSTGTRHIIAISGANISLIIWLLFRWLGRLVSNRAAGSITLLIIALYTLLVGGDASVVRAAVMGSLLVIGRLLGREPFGPASLMAAAISMTAANPLTLWDVGFQLSFAATLGLMLYQKPFGDLALRGLEALAGSGGAGRLIGPLQDGLLPTLAAQVTTTPLVIYHFGRLSLVSLLSNTLVLPVQPTLMVLGGSVGLLGGILPLVGQLLAWLSYAPLWWTVQWVTWTALIPLASVPYELETPALAAIYLLIAAVTWSLSRSKDIWVLLTDRLALKMAAPAVAAALLLAINLIVSRPDGRLHVHFLDVGEGEAILIETPSGKRVLVDGGPDPAVLGAHLDHRLPFWDRSLDLVIATHPDIEHVNGLPAVLERYQIGGLMTNGQESTMTAWRATLDLAAEKGVPIVTAQKGQLIRMDDGVSLAILHPTARLVERDDDNSLVLRLAYGEAAFLLTGDISQDVESRLIQDGVELAGIVLKAADGGDRHGTSEFFLEAVRPGVVVFSVGETATDRHPHPRLLDRLEARSCTIARTDKMGTIHFATDGRQLWLETDRKTP